MSREDSLSQVRWLLLDMAGTIYLGERLLDGAAEFLGGLREQGRERRSADLGI